MRKRPNEKEFKEICEKHKIINSKAKEMKENKEAAKFILELIKTSMEALVEFNKNYHKNK